MTKTLVIGDPHSSPDSSNDRFVALGKLILDIKPDVVVQIGDFLNLDSISFHERGNAIFRANHPLSSDIAAGKDAYNKMMTPIREYNKKKAAQHKKLYTPRLLWHIGNHEDRVVRYLLDKPEFVGMFPDVSMVGVEADGWEIIPYKYYSYVKGVAFTHVPMNKRENQPLRGEYVAKKVLEGQTQTTVFGHTHRLLVHDMSRHSENGKQLIQAINVGWFGDYDPHYVKGNEDSLDWWSGVVILDHLDDNGSVDISTISMERIKYRYL